MCVALKSLRFSFSLKDRKCFWPMLVVHVMKYDPNSNTSIGYKFQRNIKPISSKPNTLSSQYKNIEPIFAWKLESPSLHRFLFVYFFLSCRLSVNETYRCHKSQIFEGSILKAWLLFFSHTAQPQIKCLFFLILRGLTLCIYEIPVTDPLP